MIILTEQRVLSDEDKIHVDSLSNEVLSLCVSSIIFCSLGEILMSWTCWNIVSIKLNSCWLLFVTTSMQMLYTCRQLIRRFLLVSLEAQLYTTHVGYCIVGFTKSFGNFKKHFNNKIFVTLNIFKVLVLWNSCLLEHVAWNHPVDGNAHSIIVGDIGSTVSRHHLYIYVYLQSSCPSTVFGVRSELQCGNSGIMQKSADIYSNHYIYIYIGFGTLPMTHTVLVWISMLQTT